MTSERNIRQIRSISHGGVFSKYTLGAETPEFKERNLIYGFNGAGKTTLSRLFASLGAGKADPNLPEKTTFEIELRDGTQIRSDSAFDQLAGQVLTFNTDFVEANFRWKDGVANPVFYLGKANTDLSKELERNISELGNTVPQRDAALALARTSDNAFAQHKRDRARLIESELNLSRRYNATDLARDYQTESVGDQFVLDEPTQTALRKTITQSEPPQKVSALPPLASLVDLFSDTKRLLERTIGEIALSDIREHDTMLNWVETGYTYHRDHRLDNCLLCGNEIGKERMVALGKVIDSSIEDLSDAIDNGLTRIASAEESVRALRTSVPSPKDLRPELSSKYATERERLFSELKNAEETLSSAKVLLGRKAERLSLKFQPDEIALAMPPPSRPVTPDIASLNKTIESHNLLCDQFTLAREEARKKLKKHYLSEGHREYESLEEKTNRDQSAATQLEHRVALLTQSIKDLNEQLRTHGPAAEKINDLLARYLGHAELKLEAMESGYQIARSTGQLGNLSEGEKTALSLCYFLSSLEADGRKLSDTIVVIDDPISSLDSKSLNYAASLLKRILFKSRQLFLLTHSLSFMNEIKKWLYVRKDPGTSPLFFLDLKRSIDGKIVSCSIIKMPKLIREYESEYHYLFDLVLIFSTSDASYDDYFYLMPNALRKVLDTFLAFKEPGSGGLESKLESLHATYPDLDRDKIKALERLAQLESHADNLDDLVSMSPITLEETKQASVSLLALIEAVDKVHFDRMKKLCK